MCATCGCGAPKNKHGQKTLAAANKKFAKKTTTKKAGEEVMTKAADKKQDAKAMKDMSPGQRIKFAKEDKKMDKKPVSRKEDTKKDNALAKKIKGKK